jgi:hypothetical protein
MRFNVPQFITIEDKLLGIITFRQLFLVFGAFILTYIASKFLPGILTVLVGIILFGLAFAFGWVKVNNKYLLNFLPNLLLFLFSSRKYIWKEVIEITTKRVNAPTLEKYIKLLEEKPIEEEKVEVDKPLSRYIQYAHKHGYNPEDPYINFPLPKFPKRRW